MVLPNFDIEGGVALALVRGASVAALLSVFGSLLVRTVVAPPALARQPGTGAATATRRLRAVTGASLAAAIAATLGWLLFQSGLMAEAPSLGAALRTVPIVLQDTAFGHVLALRIGVLLATAATVGGGTRRLWLATVLSGIAVALQGGHGHALAMHAGPSLLLLSEVVHLLAAGAWLGGLLPLALLISAVPPDVAMTASQRFSPLGIACVALLATSAAFQFWVLIGDPVGLIGTGYGLVALAKAALFGALLVFAVRNRQVHTPGLAGELRGRVKRRLVRSIAIETGVGLLVVLAAGVLTSLPPAMHEEPLWPFSVRPSFAAIEEDDAFRREVIAASFAMGGAAALLVIAALLRHWLRWVAVGVALVAGALAAPHFDLLFVEAYPTSYEHSPTGFESGTIVRGASLFPQHCADCHGSTGRGDGPLAKGLPVPPADLTAAHLWLHSDGELIWWLSHGIDAPEGGVAMPGFAGTLPEDDRWSLIDYIRAHNAGLTYHGTGLWSPPLQAPGLEAACPGRGTVMLDELRGLVVRLVFGDAPIADVGDDSITILVGSAAQHADGACRADDEAIAPAYAIISGIPLAELAGTQFLIDGDGWLRALQRPGERANWNDPHGLAAAVAEIRSHPIAAANEDGHAHMQM